MNLRKKTDRRLPLFFALVVAFAGCENNKEPNTLYTYPVLNQCVSKIDGYYYIAQLMPMEFLGGAFAPSIVLAITEINAGGGIHGKPLGLIACDTEGDVTRAKNLIAELATIDTLGGIVGPGLSAVALAVIEDAILNNLVMISGSATSPDLTIAPDNGFFFRTTVSDALIAKVEATIANTAHYQNVFIIHPKDDWGARLTAEFEATYSGIAEKHAYDPNVENFATAAVTAAKMSGLKTVYLVAYPSHSEAIFKSAIAIGDFFPNWLMYSQHTEIISSIGSYLNGATGITKMDRTNDPSYQHYIDSFIKAYGPGKWAISDPYDAVYLLALAMSLAQDPADGIQVRDALARTAGGTVVRPGQWPQIIATLPEGEMNYEGASGPVDFDINGDVYYDFQQWVFQNGTYHPTLCWSWEGSVIPCN